MRGSFKSLCACRYSLIPENKVRLRIYHPILQLNGQWRIKQVSHGNVKNGATDYGRGRMAAAVGQ